MVAFSGGADSAFLLAAAVRALGPDQVVAATAYSDSLAAVRARPGPRVRRVARRPGGHPGDPRDRAGGLPRATTATAASTARPSCSTYSPPLAEEHGIAYVATGTNADDARAGFRPGIRAAAERGAITPLLDAGLTKEQVREASRRWGLPTWDKPAAACLSSRIAYGVEVSPAPAGAGRARRGGGARRCCRAGPRPRPAGAGPRRPAPASSWTPSCSARDLPEVLAAVRAAPASPTPTVDPRGFRSGSMNELLPIRTLPVTALAGRGRAPYS